jgi:alkylation response protein AidB-like acyl-CoA dehydrogenase
MDTATLLKNIRRVSDEFGQTRADRQRRRTLDRADFDALHNAGFTQVGLPLSAGGLWSDVHGSVRTICEALRILARGDSSVALVSAMHPAVLSYWLTVPEQETHADGWDAQTEHIFQSVRGGHWWGTITSEPGTGGDVARTRATAECGDSPLQYRLSGQKHFGSGSGISSFMVTTALPEGEETPDWFYVDMHNVPWDGSQGLTLIAEWDGHGMTATQSHGMKFDRFPATRIASKGHLTDVAARTGGFIGCLFAAVIVGIVEVAADTAREKIDLKAARPYEQVEWARIELERWLIGQALDGMIRAVEQQEDARLDVIKGKTAISELAESVMTRLCRIIGGGTFSRHSPFGYWFEDVRALGFLRPPWGLAFQTLIDSLTAE